MTENEAIKGLETLKYQCKHNGECGTCNICCSAIPLAIQALEEIQQYRAIGTVEEFNRAKEMEAVYGQVKWERDVAISQLKEIGVSLGQKMDEFKDLKEYKAKMEMQYLDDINNPLEPLKLSSALQSEIRKYEYRKEHKPQDISPLDYTIMYALKHCLEET